MSSQEAWEICKEIGDIGEGMYREYLESKNLEIKDVSVGYVPERDIVYLNSKGSMVSAEIKTDRYDSPYLSLESHTGSKLSGYLSTKATFYVMVKLADKKFYAANADKLREYMADREAELVMIDSGLSDNGTTSLLLPKEDFLEVFKCYTIPDEIYNIYEDRIAKVGIKKPKYLT